MAKKSKIAKKTVAKKSTPVKKTAKKVVSKKTASKKPLSKKVAKKATSKKAVSKRTGVKKSVAKETAPRKSVTKKVAVKRSAKLVLINKNKAVKPKLVSTASTPAMLELSEELIEKTANTGKPMMAPEVGSNASAATEDPIQAFDKHVFNKATSKGYPHSKLRLSSKPKNAIKPSGKKPLWH